MKCLRIIRRLYNKQIRIDYRNGFFFSPNVYHLGKFGKGTLSRAEPTWYQRHYQGYQPKGLSEQRLLSTFDSSKVAWFDGTDKEEFVLMPEEAYYLYQQGKAFIYSQGRSVDGWTTCCNALPSFPLRYNIYEHFRNKGWAVKSGLLFGCDFVLYSNQLEHHHSEYCVWIVEGPVETLTLLARARATHHVKKDLIVCHVMEQPSDTRSESCLPEFRFREVTLSRWIPNIEVDD
jgi:tRNA-splicing endonuclease subunit Sen2